MEPTPSQIEYIDSLCLRKGISRLQVGDIYTREDAARAIDDLTKELPISASSRASIFARLKEIGGDKAAMYASCGIASLSAESGATEADAAKCRAWLRSQSVEVHRGRAEGDLDAALAALVASSDDTYGGPKHEDDERIFDAAPDAAPAPVTPRLSPLRRPGVVPGVRSAPAPARVVVAKPTATPVAAPAHPEPEPVARAMPVRRPGKPIQRPVAPPIATPVAEKAAPPEPIAPVVVETPHEKRIRESLEAETARHYREIAERRRKIASGELIVPPTPPEKILTDAEIDDIIPF